MLKLEIPKLDDKQLPPMLLNARIDLQAPHPTAHARMRLLVSRIPELNEFSFEQRNDIWYAEKHGIAKHFYWRGPENARGFGGQHFNIQTTDGKMVVLKGPWSTRAGAVNAEGFGPCVDVSLTDDPSVFTGRGTFIAGTVTLAFAELACEIIGNTKMIKTIDGSDIDYEATGKWN